MSLLARVRSFLGGLFGRGGEEADATETPAADAADSDATAAPEAPAEYECSICGSPVADPAGPCPLCRSTDVVARDDAATAEPSATASGLDPEGTTVSVSRSDGDEAAVDRLRELRNQQARDAESGGGGEAGDGDRDEAGDDDGSADGSGAGEEVPDEVGEDDVEAN